MTVIKKESCNISEFMQDEQAVQFKPDIVVLLIFITHIAIGVMETDLNRLDRNVFMIGLHRIVSNIILFLQIRHTTVAVL